MTRIALRSAFEEQMCVHGQCFAGLQQLEKGGPRGSSVPHKDQGTGYVSGSCQNQLHPLLRLWVPAGSAGIRPHGSAR